MLNLLVSSFCRHRLIYLFRIDQIFVIHVVGQILDINNLHILCCPTRTSPSTRASSSHACVERPMSTATWELAKPSVDVPLIVFIFLICKQNTSLTLKVEQSLVENITKNTIWPSFKPVRVKRQHRRDKYIKCDQWIQMLTLGGQIVHFQRAGHVCMWRYPTGHSQKTKH